MQNSFCKTPLRKASKILVEVAAGRRRADSVIKGASLVNVCTGEIQKNIDVAIAEGRIALVGEAGHCVGDGTKVIDAGGAYIAPGFLDGHIHVESSMLSVGEYARAVIPRGTVGIYMDPHEICNVLGVEGVNMMIQDSLRTPLKTMVTFPSCVPGMPGYEDTGACIGASDIRKMMASERVVGLGEMMNVPGVLAGRSKTLSLIGRTLKSDKVVTGHYAARDNGKNLSAYIAAGARCCHESTRAEDALAKMRLGMYAQIREGSAWHDLKEVSKAVTRHKVDTRFVNLVSDDTHPYTLVNDGHIDHILRRAIKEGIDPVTAIQTVTINCAECFRMAHEFGSITPGKCADIVFIEDLKNMKVTRVMIDGEVAAENGEMTREIPEFAYPSRALNTMNIGYAVTADCFHISAPSESPAKIRAIEITAGKTM
ncbi:MAG: amidohydrolase family protein, partial [Oscillospiraceae bacterium]|nr:amidohydrolase family protein [Oscillospiraceae bacterium]